jgi:hypothetical protein
MPIVVLKHFLQSTLSKGSSGVGTADIAEHLGLGTVGAAKHLIIILVCCWICLVLHGVYFNFYKKLHIQIP